MSRLLGIDIEKTVVRTAIVRTAYRKTFVEAIGEARIEEHGSVEAALRAALVGAARPDACAVALSGERTLYRRIDLPAAAAKELEEFAKVLKECPNLESVNLQGNDIGAQGA